MTSSSNRPCRHHLGSKLLRQPSSTTEWREAFTRIVGIASFAAVGINGLEAADAHTCPDELLRQPDIFETPGAKLKAFGDSLGRGLSLGGGIGTSAYAPAILCPLAAHPGYGVATMLVKHPFGNNPPFLYWRICII